MKRKNINVLILSIITIFVLLINGCATTTLPVGPVGRYVVEIDSIALPDADLKNKTYTLATAMKNVNEYDIQFKEFARYIENALAKTGYKRLDSEDANLIIRLAYGIGAPKTETSRETYTTATGYSYMVGWTWIHVPPQTEIITSKNTTCERFLILEAYDSQDRRSQLWRTSVKSKGSSSDLRLAIPHMIAAAIYNFGKDSKGKINTAMYVNTPRVLDIMQYSHIQSTTPFTGKERLGVRYQQLTPGNQLLYKGQKTGVLVLDVAKNSVAQKMGIKQYDIILAVNNRIINKQQILLEAVQSTKPGGKIQLTFFSWDKIRDVSGTDRLQ